MCDHILVKSAAGGKRSLQYMRYYQEHGKGEEDVQGNGEKRRVRLIERTKEMVKVKKRAEKLEKMNERKKLIWKENG